MKRGIFKPLLLLSTAVVLGCSGGYDELVPVTGKVTFDGGPPPAPGIVTFVPTGQVAGQLSRTGTGRFMTDGLFEATSFQPGDGLFPGAYTVTVMCNKGKLDYSKKDPFGEASYVPRDFKPLELVVEEGSGGETLTIDVPPKKS